MCVYKHCIKGHCDEHNASSEQYVVCACLNAHVYIGGPGCCVSTSHPLHCSHGASGIYEIFTGKKCEVGVQAETLPDTETVSSQGRCPCTFPHTTQCPLHTTPSSSQAVYVMPSTSGRAATYPKRADKLKFFVELKQLRDNLRLKHGRPTPQSDQAVPDQDHPGEGSGAAVKTSPLPTPL